MALDDTLPADGQELDEGLADETAGLHATAFGGGIGAAAEVPTRIGRFSIERRLGAGSMGVVLAAHDEELDRPVAIKLLRGVGNEVERIRLRREAQALAQLSHPHVVQVFEIGTWEGLSYLVMERVDGASLDDWLRAQPRALAEILDAFAQAGEGLSTAHAAGLVHRDFKPGNVLVGSDGRVRVVDFGLARLGAEPPSDDDAAALAGGHDDALGPVWSHELTRTGALMGTPAYMSPEQLAAGPVTAASDQFSFCVALYEALYGQHPFVEERRWNELVHNVVQGRVRPPPERRDVPGPLRAAVLRGLCTDPSARWPAMAELVAVLRAAMRPRSWARRGVLFVGVLAALVGGTWALAVREEPSRCTGADAKLAEVWGPARRQAVERAFLATGVPYAAATWERVAPRLDAHAQAWRAGYAEACTAGPGAEGELDRRMACLERLRGAFAAQVEVLVEADAAVVEQAVVAVDGLRPAAACLRPAANEVLPPEDPALAAQHEALAQALARIEALARTGAYAAVPPLAEEALATARTLERPALEGQVAIVLAEAQRWLGDLDAAEEQLERAYFLGRQLGSDGLAGRAADGLVIVVGLERQDYARALEWARHAQAALARAEDETARADHLGSYGMLLVQRGEYEPARAALEERLALLRSTVAPHDLRIADALGDLGILLRKLGDDRAAALHHEQALAIYEDALGPAHPQVARVLNNLAAAEAVSGRLEDAVRATRRAVAIWEQTLGPDHVSIAHAAVNLAVMLGDLERHDEAEQAARRAIEILERTGAQPHTLCAALVSLAIAQHRDGRYHEAAVIHRRAVAMFEATGLGDHLDLAQELVNFGDTLERLHELEEADAVLRRALEILERAPDPPLRPRLVAHSILADVSLARGRYQDAVDHARARIELEPDPAAQAYRMAFLRLLLARARWGLGRRAHAQARLDGREAEGLAAALPPGEREDRLRHDVRAWRAEHDPAASMAPR